MAPEEVGCARLLTDQLEMQVWRIIEWTGSPRNAAPEEHDEIAWFSLSAARAVDLAHDRYLDLFEEALSLEVGRGAESRAARGWRLAYANRRIMASKRGLHSG